MPCSASSTTADPEVQRKKAFAVIVGPCLALVAPMSMTEDDRRLWMKAAFDALKHVPFDLLERGAKAALSTCTHPSKIVPTILEEIKDPLRWRTEKKEQPLRLSAPSKVKPEPFDREMLDRMQKGGGELLIAIRDLGLAAGYIYLGEDGKLHQAFDQDERHAA